MLSAIVLTCDRSQPRPAEPEAVVASLSALVPAVIAGLIRDASLAVTAGNEAMREIASHAGCLLNESAAAAEVLPAAIASARGPYVFVLRAGCVPQQGFTEELADFLRAGAQASALLRQMSSGRLASVFPRLAPIAALIGGQQRMREAGGQSLVELAGRLHASQTFRSRAMRVG